MNHLTLCWSDIIKEDLMANAASFSYVDASILADTLCFSIVYYQYTVLCKSVEILAENLAYLNMISQYILKEFEETE